MVMKMLLLDDGSINLSAKLRKTINGSYVHWCPGCNETHTFNVDKVNINTGIQYAWNKNIDFPTFFPSMSITKIFFVPESINPFKKHKTTAYPQVRTICRYWLKNGEIKYYHDCAHSLAGRTILLPNIPHWVK